MFNPYGPRGLRFRITKMTDGKPSTKSEQATISDESVHVILSALVDARERCMPIDYIALDALFDAIVHARK